MASFVLIKEIFGIEDGQKLVKRLQSPGADRGFGCFESFEVVCRENF